MTELTHYGVKGMKWGVIRDKARAANEARKAPTDVVIKEKNGDYAQSSGGRNQKNSADAIKAQRYRQMAKSSTTDSLSNQELQQLVTRMNLEQQYGNLVQQQDRRSKGQKFVHKLLGMEVNGSTGATGKTAALAVAEMYSPSGAKVAGYMLNQAEKKTAPPKGGKKKK